MSQSDSKKRVKVKRGRTPRWTPKEFVFMHRLKAEGLDWKQIERKFKETPGCNPRTEGAIRTQYRIRYGNNKRNLTQESYLLAQRSSMKAVEQKLTTMGFKKDDIEIAFEKYEVNTNLSLHNSSLYALWRVLSISKNMA